MTNQQRHQEVLASLQPLPIQGDAWPTPIKTLAWIVLLVIGLKLVQTATRTADQSISPAIVGTVILLFGALIVFAWLMQTSKTTISTAGISQTWLTKRYLPWEELHFAKFVPLLGSKRLICFTARNRPVVFQAGNQELQIAFAKIALIYRKSPH